MASTPSASALSAVLRCRGNIWTRNTPTKRPATAGYSLGLAGGALRDSPDERNRPNQTPAWEAFVTGERVVVARRLTIAYMSPRVAGNILRENDVRKMNKLGYLKLSQLPDDAHSAAHYVQNALARRLTRDWPICAKIMLKYQTCPAHICKIVLAQEISSYPSGVLKVSIMSRCLVETSGQLVKTLKSTCFSLTVLVSEIMLLWRSSSSSSSSSRPNGASKHMLCQQDEENIKHNVLQANGQNHSPINLTPSKDRSGCGQKITEDRPD